MAQILIVSRRATSCAAGGHEEARNVSPSSGERLGFPSLWLEEEKKRNLHEPIDCVVEPNRCLAKIAPGSLYKANGAMTAFDFDSSVIRRIFF